MAPCRPICREASFLKPELPGGRRSNICSSARQAVTHQQPAQQGSWKALWPTRSLSQPRAVQDAPSPLATSAGPSPSLCRSAMLPSPSWWAPPWAQLLVKCAVWLPCALCRCGTTLIIDGVSLQLNTCCPCAALHMQHAGACFATVKMQVVMRQATLAPLKAPLVRRVERPQGALRSQRPCAMAFTLVSLPSTTEVPATGLRACLKQPCIPAGAQPQQRSSHCPGRRLPAVQHQSGCSFQPAAGPRRELRSVGAQPGHAGGSG